MPSVYSLSLELETGRLVKLNVKGFPLKRRWYALHRKGKHLTRVAKAFLDYLQSYRLGDEVV
jgi:LysR family transcriptional regulator, low CO2-responsive transcriptional regulator